MSSEIAVDFSMWSGNHPGKSARNPLGDTLHGKLLTRSFTPGVFMMKELGFVCVSR